MNDDFQTVDNALLRKAGAELTRRILKTQSEIRRVDLLAAICAFVTLTLALLLFGIVLDCWILPRGMSVLERVYYAIFGLTFTLFFSIWRLIPVFLKRVNLLFAAKELEIAWGDKHNLTINWLQLCKLTTNPVNDANPSSVREEVLRGALLQAARNASVHSETNVDYSRLIRWGTAFAIVVAICSGYIVVSSKNPFIGARRIITPLAEVARPQALNFKKVEPGNVIAYQGDFLDIEAEIPGTNDSSIVEMLYSTSDGRLIDVAIPMESRGASTFHASFPNDQIGLIEDITYRVVAERGTRMESASELYTIEVRPIPSFRVEKITLSFPEYTGLADQTFENQGDVRALEGTRVSLTARCNEDLARASFLPNGERPLAQKMKVDANNLKLASIDFNLEWIDKDANGGNPSSVQPFSFYQILSRDVDGQENRDLQNYSVSIVPDLPPTVRWETDSDDVVEIPFNDVLHVRLEAEDPDYSLRSASLMFAFHNLNADNDALDNRHVPPPLELSFASSSKYKKADYSNGSTPFVGVNHIFCDISPEKIGLSVDDEVEYWAVVYDSKLPNPNSVVSEKRIFKVVHPVDNPLGIDLGESELEEESSPNSVSSQDETSNGGENDPEDQNPSSDGPTSDEPNQNASPDDQGEQNKASHLNNSETDGSPSESPKENDEEKGNSRKNSKNSPQQNESKNGSNSTGDEQKNPSQETVPDQGKQSENSGTNKSKETGAKETGSLGQNDPENTQSEQVNPRENNPSSYSDIVQPFPQGVPPNKAFEKILDYMNGIESSVGETAPDKVVQQSEQSSGGANSFDDNGVGSEGKREEKLESRNEKNEKEVKSNFDSDVDLPQPNEKRELPVRTSPEKPNSSAKSYQAEHPDFIDVNTPRKEGDVDPKTNNYLGQNPNEDLSASNKVNDNANILLDPQDQSQAVAAEAVDSNAAEANGVLNSEVGDAPFEIDQDSNKKTNQTNNSRNDVDHNNLPKEITNNGNSHNDGDNVRNSGGVSNEFGNDDGNNQGASQTSKNNSPSGGDSNDNSKRQGGGGGSGMGEITFERQMLSPADLPKLQYAEKATNLVLDYLESSLKDEPDHELLDELGWTEEQLRDFLKRWQLLRAAAENGNKKELKTYLRALEEITLDAENIEIGVFDASFSDGNERINKGFQSKSTGEASRIKTPERLSERVRAFTQGVSQNSRR